jgi:hypothetical protein
MRLTKRTGGVIPVYKANATAAELGLGPNDVGVYSWYSDDSNPTRDQRKSIDEVRW